MLYIWITLASIVGGMLQSSIGFGFGIFMAAILPLFIESIPHAAAVSVVISLACSIFLIVPRYRYAKLRQMLPAILIYMVIMPLSNRLSLSIPRIELSIVLGFVLLGFGVYYIFFAKKLKIPANIGTAMAAGALSGTLNGMFSMGGPPMVVYCLAAFDEKETYMASLQAYFIVTNCYGVGVRALNGLMTSQVLLWIAAGLVGMFAGLFIGRRIYRKLDLNAVRKYVYIFICCAGGYMVISNLFKLI